MKRYELLFCLLVAGCGFEPGPVPLPPANPTPPPVRPIPPAPAGAVKYTAELIEAHNAYRQSKGLNVLLPDFSIQNACETQAADMAAHNTMSHTGSDGSSVAQRMTTAGYAWSKAGENIAYNQATVSAVMRSWEGSPGHLANIVTPDYVNIGAACVYSSSNQPYWCVDFGTPGRGMARAPEKTVIEQTDGASSLRHE